MSIGIGYSGTMPPLYPTPARCISPKGETGGSSTVTIAHACSVDIRSRLLLRISGDLSLKTIRRAGRPLFLFRQDT